MHVLRIRMYNFHYTPVRLFLSTNYFAHLVEKQASRGQDNVMWPQPGVIAGTELHKHRWRLGRHPSSCVQSLSPNPSFPHVNHSLGDYISFSLQQSVIMDISFREANTEGQKYPQACLIHL